MKIGNPRSRELIIRYEKQKGVRRGELDLKARSSQLAAFWSVKPSGTRFWRTTPAAGVWVLARGLIVRKRPLSLDEAEASGRPMFEPAEPIDIFPLVDPGTR